MTFVLAMVQNPEIQLKAQAEIDSVTGSDRLPEMADRDSMPYLERIVREVLRWQPVLPLGRSTIYEYMHQAYLTELFCQGSPELQHKMTNTWGILFLKDLLCKSKSRYLLYVLFADALRSFSNTW